MGKNIMGRKALTLLMLGLCLSVFLAISSSAVFARR